MYLKWKNIMKIIANYKHFHFRNPKAFLQNKKENPYAICRLPTPIAGTTVVFLLPHLKTLYFMRSGYAYAALHNSHMRPRIIHRFIADDFMHSLVFS